MSAETISAVLAALSDALRGMSDDDLATLRAWVATFGDGATDEAIRARVRLLLTLRIEHPGRPSLDALLDEPMACAVLNASLEGRPGVMRRYRRWCARLRSDA